MLANMFVDYTPPPAVIGPKEDDYEEIMKKFTKLPQSDYGDLFEGSSLTELFTVLVGEQVVNTLRSEYISWSDVRVGTIREMMDLDIPVEIAQQIKATLNAAYRTTGGRNIEALSLDELANIKAIPEDAVV